MNAQELRVALEVSDFARSVAFYENQLGMRRITAWDGAEGPGMILQAGPRCTVELFGPPPGGVHAAPLTSAVKMAIGVADVTAWHAHLQAAGVSIARGLVDNPWGDRSFGVDDPDGVRIWFFEVIDPAYGRLFES